MKAFVVGFLLTMLSVACGNNDHKVAQNDSLADNSFSAEDSALLAEMYGIEAMLSREKVSSRSYPAASARPGFDLKKDGFRSFPRSFIEGDIAHLIGKIIPDTHYDYWECVYNSPNDVFTNCRGRVTVYKGRAEVAGIARLTCSEQGFFVECQPLICFSYIVGIRDRNRIDLVDSEQKLLGFIGSIDNLEEVVLSVKANGYWIDPDLMVGGAYVERTNDYLLYLSESNSVGGIYKSVRAVLSKTGKFTVLDKTIYKQDSMKWIS